MASSDPWKEYEPSKRFKWYTPNIDHKVTPEIRRLLEVYSKVAPEEVLKHIHDIRDKAWEIRPYPCTGLGGFLSPMIVRSPAYQTILSRLQRGDSFLDVGCYLGQDLRRLVFDGAPQDHLYGVDVVNHWDLGFEFFRDTDKFKAKFIEADIQHPNAKLQALAGKIDIISVTHVLHQWEWEGQVAAAKQLCLLSRPGSLIVGYQAGIVAGARQRKVVSGPSSISGKEKDDTEPSTSHQWMRQDPDTWREMWEVVGEATGTEWNTDAQTKTWEEVGYDPNETAYLGEEARMLQFVVTRIS